MDRNERNERIYRAYVEDMRRHGEIDWDRIRDGLEEEGISLSRRQTRRIAYQLEEERGEKGKAEAEFEARYRPGLDDEELPDEDAESIEFRIAGDYAEGNSAGKSIRSLEQLLEAIEDNGGDLDPWRVKRHVVNVWETGRKAKVVDMEWRDGVANGFVKDSGGWTNKANWQVKAWFVPKEEYPLEQAVQDVIDRIVDYAPDYDPPPPLNTDGEYLFVPNVYDAHFGKRSHDGNYGVQDAKEDYIKAARALAGLAQRGGRKVKRIMFPVGHDILHVDSLRDETTKGTWVETSADIRDAIDAVCEAVPRAIEAFATIAPVDVIPVESNHDRLQVHWLGQALHGWFRKHPNVTVRIGRAERQYYRWGRVLIGLTHQPAKGKSLHSAMSVEAREHWGHIKWTEWLTGHTHTKSGSVYVVNEETGTIIRTIPALCPPDTYHKLRIYVGAHRAAEAIYYHETSGPAGIIPVFVDEI